MHWEVVAVNEEQGNVSIKRPFFSVRPFLFRPLFPFCVSFCFSFHRNTLHFPPEKCIATVFLLVFTFCYLQEANKIIHKKRHAKYISVIEFSIKRVNTIVLLLLVFTAPPPPIYLIYRSLLSKPFNISCPFSIISAPSFRKNYPVGRYSNL